MSYVVSVGLCASGAGFSLVCEGCLFYVGWPSQHFHSASGVDSDNGAGKFPCFRVMPAPGFWCWCTVVGVGLSVRRYAFWFSGRASPGFWSGRMLVRVGFIC
jgi:hypothetical protein